MKWQAYFDESYSPGGHYVLAGYLATKDMWCRFNEQWAAMLKFGVLDLKTGVYRFKYQEMSATPERSERIPYFERLIKDHAVLAISCHLNLKDYEKVKQRIHVNGQTLDYTEFTAFYLSLRHMFDKFHNSREFFASVLPVEAKVEFIFDEQSWEQGSILRDWDAYFSSRSELVRDRIAGPPRFLKDDQCYPLQAADLLAGMLRSAYSENTIGQLLSPSVDAPPSEEKKIMHVIMEWDEEALLQEFIAAARQKTDAVIYDIKLGEIEI